MKKIPVILDTDIGSDIDDTWALAMLLKSPELDLKLVTTTTDDTIIRARIVARLLEIAGRTDVAIGIGTWQDTMTGGQVPWVENYDLDRYPGTVYRNSAEAIVSFVMNSPEPVTIISIAPLPDSRLSLRAVPEWCRIENFPRAGQNPHLIDCQSSVSSESGAGEFRDGEPDSPSGVVYAAA